MLTLSPSYPKNAVEWRDFIASKFGISPEEGKTYYQAKNFPTDSFISWIRQEFSVDSGYSHTFIPAIVRNLEGLITWIYGEGNEPYWPGEDGDQL